MLQFKEAVADAINSYLAPIQSEYERLERDPAYVHTVLDAGADRARSIANTTMQGVYDLVGLRVSDC